MNVYLSEAMKKSDHHTDISKNPVRRFEALRPRLRAWAERLLQDRDDAEDALQEAFFRLWRRGTIAESAQESVDLGAASMTAVRSVCIDMLRSRKVRHSEPLERADENVIPATNPLSEMAEDVAALIGARLDERTRNILLLHDAEEMSYEEIAARYGITEANCRLIVSRARKTIREAYRQRHRN